MQELAAASAGEAESNSSSAAIPAGFANFHGVTVKSTVWLDAASTLRSLHSRFDNVAQRKFHVDLFRMQSPQVSNPHHSISLSSLHGCESTETTPYSAAVITSSNTVQLQDSTHPILQCANLEGASPNSSFPLSV